MDNQKTAFELMTATDEEFAEFFVYAAKLKGMGYTGPDGREMPAIILDKKDMTSFDSDYFFEWLKTCVNEIIFGTENNQSAWWKQEEENGN